MHKKFFVIGHPDPDPLPPNPDPLPGPEPPPTPLNLFLPPSPLNRRGRRYLSSESVMRTTRGFASRRGGKPVRCFTAEKKRQGCGVTPSAAIAWR